MSDLPQDNPYYELSRVLSLALDQAANGKGKERHAGEGERFEDQQIVQIGEWLGSNHFEIGQTCKKALESARLPKPRAMAELLGAINYLAAAYLIAEKRPEEECNADYKCGYEDGLAQGYGQGIVDNQAQHEQEFAVLKQALRNAGWRGEGSANAAGWLTLRLARQEGVEYRKGFDGLAEHHEQLAEQEQELATLNLELKNAREALAVLQDTLISLGWERGTVEEAAVWIARLASVRSAFEEEAISASHALAEGSPYISPYGLAERIKALIERRNTLKETVLVLEQALRKAGWAGGSSADAAAWIAETAEIAAQRVRKDAENAVKKLFPTCSAIENESFDDFVAKAEEQRKYLTAEFTSIWQALGGSEVTRPGELAERIKALKAQNEVLAATNESLQFHTQELNDAWRLLVDSTDGIGIVERIKALIERRDSLKQTVEKLESALRSAGWKGNGAEDAAAWIARQQSRIDTLTKTLLIHCEG